MRFFRGERHRQGIVLDEVAVVKLRHWIEEIFRDPTKVGRGKRSAEKLRAFLPDTDRKKEIHLNEQEIEEIKHLLREIQAPEEEIERIFPDKH